MKFKISGQSLKENLNKEKSISKGNMKNGKQIQIKQIFKKKLLSINQSNIKKK